MRAAVLHEHRRPFAIEEVDLAPPGQGEVEVRLHASGVCRSDWSTVTGDTPSPLPAVLGHEGAGVVERVGPGVGSVEPGPVRLVRAGVILRQDRHDRELDIS